MKKTTALFALSTLGFQAAQAGYFDADFTGVSDLDTLTGEEFITGETRVNSAKAMNNILKSLKYLKNNASGGKFVDGTDPANAVFSGGNVGIGTNNPQSRLTINNNGGSEVTINNNGDSDSASLRMKGSDGDYIIDIQNKGGRVNHYWGVTGDLEPNKKFTKDGVHASRFSINDGYMEFYGGDASGKSAGDAVEWKRGLHVNKRGVAIIGKNVGSASDSAPGVDESALLVSGDIKIQDTKNTCNNKTLGSIKFSQGLQQSIQGTEQVSDFQGCIGIDQDKNGKYDTYEWKSLTGVVQ